MSFHDYYTPQRIGELYTPNIQSAVNAGRSAGVSPSSDDFPRIYLLLVDMQIDFVHPDGALSVPGAVDDSRRVVDWIYANTPHVTTIGASLDSHLTIQIFLPTWWVDANGDHPAPFTPISHQDVASGKWKPLYEPEWSLEYTEKLEEDAKKQLMIWTFHCQIGTPGHALVPALSEALAYHAAARQSQPTLLTKGTIPKTEHYSIMEPEVKVSDQPNGDVNMAFLEKIADYDLIYIAGQAKSHCVLETVASMMRYYPPDTIQKIRVLEDAMSSVAHPEIDFDAIANEAFDRFRQNGLMMSKTTDPIA
jgi:nicotinamidase-related amidase